MDSTMIVFYFYEYFITVVLNMLMKISSLSLRRYDFHI